MKIKVTLELPGAFLSDCTRIPSADPHIAFVLSHSSTTSSSTSPPLNFFQMSPVESQREAMLIAEELRESGSIPLRYNETDEEAVKKRIKLEQKGLEGDTTIAEKMPQKDLEFVKRELEETKPLFPTDPPHFAEQENSTSRSSSAPAISGDIDMKPPLLINSRSPSTSLSISDPTKALPGVLTQLDRHASTSSSDAPVYQMKPLSDFPDSRVQVMTVGDEIRASRREEEEMEDEEEEELKPRKFSRSPGPEFEIKPSLKEESPALLDSLRTPLEGKEELKDEDGSLWEGDDDTDSSLTPLEDAEETEDEGDASLWEGDDNVDEVSESQKEPDNARSRSSSEESRT